MRALALLVACTVTLAPSPTHAQAAEGQDADSHAVLALQVLLDRAGFSPGEIDGAPGANTDRAATAYRAAHGLLHASEGELLDALGGRDVQVLREYTVAMEDVVGPFVQEIPVELPDQADLDALGYTSPIELLGERFHASPELIERLNPGTELVAGAVIRVPNVRAHPVLGDGADAPPAGDLDVTVSRSASALTVRRGGEVVLHAPVTTGSEHDPLPLGDWEVTMVIPNPEFHYNPKLFWDADETHAVATLPPGPNSPVGTVWIDLTRERYGLHGTPEPSAVGHSTSHGCVRLTNWDAARLAMLVAKGTPVHFVE